MNSVQIISLLIGLLVLLVCYGFISQTLEKNRKQKQRLVAALKNRAGNFRYMLDGFPQDFLPRDIKLLVVRSIIETLEQLAKLEPRQPDYLEDLRQAREQAEVVKRQPSDRPRKPLTNPAQIKEIRQHLQELLQFVELLRRRGSLDGDQADAYQQQITQLNVQVAVDAYMHNAKIARFSNKLRLAIHYYSLAKKNLLRENTQGQFQGQIDRLNETIAKLEEEYAASGQAQNEPTSADDALSKQWDSFAEEEAKWKKKSLYD